MHFKSSYPILASVQNTALKSTGDSSVKQEKSLIYKNSFSNHLLLTVQNNKASAMTINSGAGFKFDFKNILSEAEVKNISYTDAYGWHKTQEGTCLVFTYEGEGGQSLSWDHGSSFTFEVSGVSCAHPQDEAKKLIIELKNISGAYCQQPMIHFLDPPTCPNNLQILCDFETRTTVPSVTGKNYAPAGLPDNVIYYSPDPSSKIFNSLNFYLANGGSLAIKKGHIKIWFDTADIEPITDTLPAEQKNQLEAQNAMEKAACIAVNQTIFDNYSLEIKETYGNPFKPIQKNQGTPTSWTLIPQGETLLPGNSGTKSNYNRIELQFQDVISFLSAEGLANLYISFEKMDNYNSAIFMIPIEKKKPEAQILDFSPLHSSLVLEPGEKAQLKWKTFLVDRVKLAYVDGTGSEKELDSARQASLSPNEQAFTLPDAFQEDETTQITLYAYQKVGDTNPIAQKELTFQVTKAKPRILSFTGELDLAGEKLTIKWSTQNAENCYLNDEPCSTSGTKTLDLSGETLVDTYQLKIKNSVGTDSRAIQPVLDPTPIKYFNFGAKLLTFNADGSKLLIVENDQNATSYEVDTDSLENSGNGDITNQFSLSSIFDYNQINDGLRQNQFSVTVDAFENDLKTVDYLNVTTQSFDGSTDQKTWYYFFFNKCSFCFDQGTKIISFPYNFQPNGSALFAYASPPTKNGFYLFSNANQELGFVEVSSGAGGDFNAQMNGEPISDLANVQIDAMVALPKIAIFCAYSDARHYYYHQGQLLPFSGPTNGPSPVAAWGIADNAALLFQAEKDGNNNWNLSLYYLDADKGTKTKRQSFALPTDDNPQTPVLAISPDGGPLVVSTGSKIHFFMWKNSLDQV